MVTLRGVAVHRVMAAHKLMKKPILTINSEIVEERILRGDQQDTVPRILTLQITLLCCSVRSVNAILCYLRKTHHVEHLISSVPSRNASNPL